MGLAHWDERGKPCTLLGAAVDALLWLEWIKQNVKLTPENAEQKLKDCIEALRRETENHEQPTRD